MKKIALYTTYIEGIKRISLNPPESLTECSIEYQLIPETGKILKNTKTGEYSRCLIIPHWKEKQWIEEDI